MEHFAGPDVSVGETSVCIVDDTGTIVWEMKVASEPDVAGARPRHTVRSIMAGQWEGRPTPSAYKMKSLAWSWMACGR
jgi:hypothetical protein